MRLATHFRSVKNLHPASPTVRSPRGSKTNFSPESNRKNSRSSTSSPISDGCGRGIRASTWGVYLIISTKLPRTYVGVTTNFNRRLKQHNGELKGGAKASSAGRPWVFACTIQGFKYRSEACEFESRWKNISRKIPRRKRKEEQPHVLLLQHREEALSKVKTLLTYSHLNIDWKTNIL